MIRLRLRGFQAHEDTEIPLSGNFICIVGANNVGKSAIVRALRWVFYDALRGIRFIKKGKSKAVVELEIDKTNVQRLKGAGRNAYELNGQPLEAIGKGTPPEIQSALKVHPIRIDKDSELELNIVRQSEHPFLMGVPGSVRARTLNALTGRHVLDSALRTSAAKSKEFSAEENRLQVRISEIDSSLAAFSTLDDEISRVEKADSLRSEINESVAKARDIRAISQEVNSKREEVNRLASLPSLDMGRVNSMESELASKSQTYEEGSNLLISWGETLALLDSIASSPAIDLSRADLLADSISDISNKCETIREDLQMLLYAKNSLEAETKKKKLDLQSVDSKISGLELLSQMNQELVNLKQAVSARKAEAERSELLKVQLERAEAQIKMLIGSACGECGRPITEECLA